jgi:hypothetical protein
VGTVTLIHGDSGSGKTFVGINLAMAVAMGQPFASEFSTSKTDVIYFFLEDGHAGAAQRLQAASRDWNLTPEGLAYAAYGPSLSNEADWERLVRLVKRRRPGLVVLDTLALALGGADENSNTEMTQIIRNLTRLGTLLDCATLLVHHRPKSKESKGPRGASALFGNVAGVLAVDRNNGVPGGIKLRVEKSKQSGLANREGSVIGQLVEVEGTKSLAVRWGGWTVSETKEPKEDRLASEIAKWHKEHGAWPKLGDIVNGNSTPEKDFVKKMAAEGYTHSELGTIQRLITDDMYNKEGELKSNAPFVVQLVHIKQLERPMDDESDTQ